MGQPTVVTSYARRGLKGSGIIRVAEYPGAPVQDVGYIYETIKMNLGDGRRADGLLFTFPNYHNPPIVKFAKFISKHMFPDGIVCPGSRCIMRITYPLDGDAYLQFLLGNVFGRNSFAILTTGDLTLAKDLEANAQGFVAPLT